MRSGEVRAAAIFFGTLLYAPTALAQETFFQIPAGLIAPKGEVFTQSQATVNEQLDFAGQGVFGLGRGFEIGLSLYNFDVKRYEQRGLRLAKITRPGDDPLGPLAMFTAQKSLELTSRFSFTAGTQSGTQLLGDARHLVTREYVNAVYALAKETRFLVGGWHGNGSFLGGDRRVGVWLGAEVELVHDRLSIEADFISGHQANGATSVGPKIMFTDDVSLTVGAQIPNPHGEAKWAGLAQLELDDFLGLF